MSATETSRHELGPGFAGELIGPEDPGYDEARALFNAMIDKRPALIARCTSADDVAAVIAYARSNDLPGAFSAWRRPRSSTRRRRPLLPARRSPSPARVTPR